MQVGGWFSRGLCDGAVVESALGRGQHDGSPAALGTPPSTNTVCTHPQEPNNGVPGDWITGNRMLDVTLLPLIFAVLFPVLRTLLKKHVFQVRVAEEAWTLPAPQHTHHTTHCGTVPC